MAAESEDGQERTEDPTDERREEFRKRGEVVQSHEISSVLTLLSAIIYLSIFGSEWFIQIKKFTMRQLFLVGKYELTDHNVSSYFAGIFKSFLLMVIPLFLVVAATGSFTTLLQTRLNFSWERLQFDIGRLNPLKGLMNMVNTRALVELAKGIGKILVISGVSVAVIFSAYYEVPKLLNSALMPTISFWGSVTKSLFWSVCSLLLLIGGLDYLYNFITIEKRMRMTKQEIKKEYKDREVNPQIRNKMRRMARDISMRKMLSETEKATVIITNPQHYAVAILYNFGMRAPKVIAKGVDFNALKIREVANQHDVPIIENPPLARTLYKSVEVGDDVPESLYRALTEIIRQVFKVKGIHIPKKSPQKRRTTPEHAGGI